MHNTYKASACQEEKRHLGIRGTWWDTLLNSEAGFEFWGVIFSFMLKEDEKISMVSPELKKLLLMTKYAISETLKDFRRLLKKIRLAFRFKKYMASPRVNYYNRSLSFWTLSFHYLNLVQAALTEIIKHGNKWLVISDQPIEWEEYNKTTKWSDFNIIVPLLYNFYHSLELLLKGFILLKKTDNSVKLDHDIERLLSDFLKQYPEEHCLINVLNKYIGQNISSTILSNFLKENNYSSNRFFELLRYPADLNLRHFFTYMQLKYNGGEVVAFFEELQSDIECMRRCAVSLAQMYEHKYEDS